MSSASQFLIRIDKDLKLSAQKKANEELGIGLGTLTKLFLKYFVEKKTKSTLAFYVDDKEFDKILDKTLKSKKVKNAFQKLSKSI